MRFSLIAMLMASLQVPSLALRAQSPGWRAQAVPGNEGASVARPGDGLAWYRCFVKLPAGWKGQVVTLAVEHTDGAQETFFNGAKVGGAGKFPPHFQNGSDAAGRYSLPADRLRFGEWNVVAIRVYQSEGGSSFKGAAPVIGTEKEHITLAGTWEFRMGDELAWAQAVTDATPSFATFAKVESGPAPKPSAGHQMADRATPLPPAEAAKTFTVPDDLEIEPVLAEPDIAQPVFLNFDERGRMWVVEYRQYPSPAGLTVVSHDKFWRAVYDKVPEPPPRGPRGLDRISIHEDTDGDGRYDKHKVFVDGLNIATSCVKGRGGVWVLNPPYLLFYPDKNDDDVPDGDPVVHLEGFGLEDTHSVVNSLRWGPDGWLYAAQGSTVTANVRVRGTNDAGRARREPRPVSADYLRRSTRPGEPPVYSQGQNIWRYHPERHIYEIFAEGGGNAFGVEFDDKGRLFSGHNGGDTRGFHYMQGTYLRKGFEKHGELSNPYAFGYFPDMPGTKGERFSHTFLIYHGGALPPRYEGKLFGCEPLQGRVVLSEITPDGSTFKTRDLERVVTSSDSWFRPVDIKAGPDGAIYIADWYDRQVTHTRNQEGNIDASNGRIYRLKKKGAKAVKPINLATNSTDILIKSFASRNQWIRETARRIIADRKEKGAWKQLTAAMEAGDPQQSLEAWWALMTHDDPRWGAISAMQHPSPHVRAWGVRSLDNSDDAQFLPFELRSAFIRAAEDDTSVEVRAQIACTLQRVDRGSFVEPLKALLWHFEDTNDLRMPLLCWWAIESHCDRNRDLVLQLFDDSTVWGLPMVSQHILSRLMRRFASTGSGRDLLACARLLERSPSRLHSEKLMRGFEEAFKGRSVAGLPDELITAMARHNVGSDAFRLRAGDAAALNRALAVITDAKAGKQRRQEFIDVLGEVRPPAALEALLRVADDERDTALRKSALTALLGYDDARIPATVLKDYAAYPAEVRPAALTLLASRAAWSLALAQAVGAGRIKADDVPLDTVRQLQRHKSVQLTALLVRLWPNASRPTTAAMQQQIAKLSAVLSDGKGDPYAGQKLFNTACASCHTLFARGGHVGPDLTAYQRSDLNALLLAVINPSAEVREGFENFNVETKDDRSFTGFLVERDARLVVLRGLDGQNITIQQSDIAEMKPAGLSLMPEGLLDPLTDQQVRDLFAYLRSTQPLAN